MSATFPYLIVLSVFLPQRCAQPATNFHLHWIINKPLMYCLLIPFIYISILFYGARTLCYRRGILAAIIRFKNCLTYISPLLRGRPWTVCAAIFIFISLSPALMSFTSYFQFGFHITYTHCLGSIARKHSWSSASAFRLLSLVPMHSGRLVTKIGRWVAKLGRWVAKLGRWVAELRRYVSG
jgi:hypothetical protein